MSKNSDQSVLGTHGWTAVPRSFAKSLDLVDKNKHAELAVADIQLPDSEIARKTYEFVKQQLPIKTFNHSMRVVYYGKCSRSIRD